MAYLAKETVAKGELVAGIIGTIDVGSLVATSITLSDDITRATTELNILKGITQKWFDTANNEALNMAKGEGSDIVSKSKVLLYQDINNLSMQSRNQAIQSAGGYRISSLVLGLEAKLYSTINHLDLKAKALIDIPESFALEKVQRYYNKLLAPHRPREIDMMILAKTGKITYTDCSTRYQEEDGLSAENANRLVEIRAQQVGKPDLHTYWLMARRGLILESEWYLLAQKGHGYSKADAEALYKDFFYTLSPMELFRISDLMPTSASWIDKKLTDLGFNDEDKALIANLISARTTKDEVTATWNIIADNYAWGLQTKENLIVFLTENHVPEIQANAKLIIADLLREKVILKLMRDSNIYLYRKDIYNEDQLLESLSDLNIGLDVSNAITRNEASKKGIDWEIPPP